MSTATRIMLPDAVSRLAGLAFGSGPSVETNTPKHLAFLPLEALELDLSDPEQRDFGDYELVELLGQGGMGVVYRARQRSLDREVAVKLLSAGPWASADFIARFQREAQSAARLTHPNIVSIYEIGQHAELNFFSMQLVKGKSLAACLDREGKLAPTEAARLLRTISEALDYAHRLGILHLDLKPANVLIDERGEPMVADFGLAKRLDEALAGDTDEVSGTPCYMAPEQALAKGQRIGVATDVYGLGAILYELITGRPPYLGSSPRHTLEMVVSGELEAPHVLNTQVPLDLSAIVMKCLHKDAAQRYLTARGLAEDLGRFLEGRQVSVRAQSTLERTSRWARREPKLAGAVLIAATSLLAGLGASTWQWRRAEAENIRAEQAASAARQALWKVRDRDVDALVAAQRPLDALAPLLDNLAEQEAVAEPLARTNRYTFAGLAAAAPALIDVLPTGTNTGQVVIDPEGRWVVTLADDHVNAQRFDLASGHRVWAGRVDPFYASTSLTVAANGRYLLGEHSNWAMHNRRGQNGSLVDLGTGAKIMPPSARFPKLVRLLFSADGEFAMVGETDDAAGGSVVARLHRVSDWRVLGKPGIFNGNLQLSSGGQRLFVFERLATHGKTPQPMEMLDAVTLERRWVVQPPEHIRAWRLSPTETTMAIGLLNGRIGLIDVASGAVRWISSPYQSSAVNEFEFSRDGRWLAAVHDSLGVQVLDIDTGTIVMPSLPVVANRELQVLDIDPQTRRIGIQGREQCLMFRIDDGAATLLHSAPGVGANSRCGMNARLGLLVVAHNSEAAVWRLRTNLPLQAQAPVLEMLQSAPRVYAARTLHVDAEQAQLQSLDGKPAGPLMRFPFAIGFALDVGERVVVSSAAMLHVRNSADGKEAYAPIELPANPVALLAQGDTILAAWAVHDDGVPAVRIATFDLANGQRLGERTLPSFRPSLALSADQRHVLAWYDDAMTGASGLLVMKRENLVDAVGSLPFSSQPEAKLIRYGALSDGVLWRMRGIGGDAGYHLDAIELETGRSLQSWPLDVPFMAATTNGKKLLAINQSNELLIFDNGASPKVIKHGLPSRDGHHGFAVSADGLRAVVFQGNAAQWLDLASGRWLAPPLSVAQTRMFTRVALGEDFALLSDDRRRQWLYPLHRSDEPIDQLRERTQALLPGDAPRLPTDAERVRQQLRAADPGPPRAAVSMAPAKHTDIEPPFVDLRPKCNLPLDRTGEQLHLAIRLDRAIVVGRHRLLGQDYEVRCGVFPKFVPDRDANVADGSRIDGIAVHGQTARAIDFLMVAPSIIVDRIDPQFAVLEIAYRNGERARKTLMLGPDLRPWLQPYYGNAPNTQRMAFIGLSAQYFESVHPRAPKPAAYHIRYDNPHPDWPIDGLAIESTRRPYSAPLLLAATLVQGGEEDTP